MRAVGQRLELRASLPLRQRVNKQFIANARARIDHRTSEFGGGRVVVQRWWRLVLASSTGMPSEAEDRSDYRAGDRPHYVECNNYHFISNQGSNSRSYEAANKHANRKSNGGNQSPFVRSGSLGWHCFQAFNRKVVQHHIVRT